MTDLREEEVEATPRQKHIRKLNREKKALKDAKKKNKPLKEEVHIVYDSRGKPKYRKRIYMPNGNVHTVLVDEQVYLNLKG